MKIPILIIISFCFLMTGCGDSIEFNKNSSSSRGGNGDNGSDGSDGFDGSVDLKEPTHSHIREQRTHLQVTHPKTKVDILFVIDNSGSMEAEQKKISQRFHNFITQIRGLDWHIGITTTDPRKYNDTGNRNWSDGRLVPFSDGSYYLKSSMNLEKVQRLFAENIQRKEDGSDIEKGIYATYRTLERSVNIQTEVDASIAEFLRYDSALAVVVVSDEDESPDDEVNCSDGCPSSTFHSKSDPDNLIDYVDRVFGPEKVFQFHSIIASTRLCLDGEGYTYGHKYRELSIKTGGVVGNICSDHYSGILSIIGNRVSNLRRTYKLDCTPQDANNNGVIDMKVIAKNGASTIPRYTVSGESISFHRDLNQGEYELIYHCLK